MYHCAETITYIWCDRISVYKTTYFKVTSVQIYLYTAMHYCVPSFPVFASVTSVIHLRNISQADIMIVN